MNKHGKFHAPFTLGIIFKQNLNIYIVIVLQAIRQNYI